MFVSLKNDNRHKVGTRARDSTVGAGITIPADLVSKAPGGSGYVARDADIGTATLSVDGDVAKIKTIGRHKGLRGLIGESRGAP